MLGKDGEAFLFLTDSGYCPVRFKGLSVLAIECNFQEDIMMNRILNGGNATLGHRIRRSHMGLSVVKDFILANNAEKTMREIHLIHLSDANSDEKNMIREIQKITGVPVYAAAG